MEKQKRDYKREYQARLARMSPDEIKEYARKWRSENVGKARKYANDWAAKNRSSVKANSSKWHKENREHRRMMGRRHRGLPEPTRTCPELCECCGGPPKWKGVLVLDHCHATGKFRGWLCNSCNVSIGMLGDGLSGVMKAVSYLTANGESCLDP